MKGYTQQSLQQRLHHRLSGNLGRALGRLVLTSFLVLVSAASQAKVGTGGTDILESIEEMARQGHRALGYGEARRELMGKIHLKSQGKGYAIRDVYCDKDYTDQDFPDGQGPAPGKVPLANILNTEHTWPQSKFGGKEKEVQKSDLHHLYPSDSELNSIRGNFPLGEVVSGEKPTKCPTSRFGKDQNGQFVFEPPQHHKGDAARALLYFSVRYGLAISAAQEKVLREWHKADPVNEGDLKRNSAVQKAQGNRNPFVDRPELVDQVSDF